MAPDALRKIVEEAMRDAEPLRLWALLVVVLVVAISGFVTSYFGAYLQAKGQRLATREDFQQLLEQTKKTTQATEEIKSKVSRRSSFHDKVLLERYTLIKDINNRLETVRINFERIKQELQPRIEIVAGRLYSSPRSMPTCS
jgi:hypothetical protein